MSKYNFDGKYIYYPGTEIPINYDGIQDIEFLNEHDRTLLFLAYREFHKQLDENTVFNQSYFVNLHKFTYNKMYPFAGKFRDVNVSKGDTIFCYAAYIKPQMDMLFEELKNDQYLKYSRHLSKEDFSRKLAYYTCELIAIHPFFEFNGRIIRMFIDMIAVYNGYGYIDYHGIFESDDNAYIEASIDCMEKQYCKMYKLIINGLLEEK